MIFKSLLSIALLVSSVCADCNPLKETDCDPNTALGISFKDDFESESKYFRMVNEKGLSYSDSGLNMSIKDRFDNPSIKSNFYIMFGKVEVVMKAAAGQGIVSSFYLQSDDLDEIDIELLGGDTNQFQSNFFSKGNTTTYTRGEYHSTPGNATSEYFTYTIEWTKDNVTWSVNNELMRTLESDDPEGFPQTPMYIMAGVWAGGDPSNSAGTIEWAGGETTYGPTYTMAIKSVIVSDYSSGDQYEYTDKSGSWSSIKLIGGEIYGRVSQAKEEFAKLKAGEEVSNSWSASSSSTDAATDWATDSAADSAADWATESATDSAADWATDAATDLASSSAASAAATLGSTAATTTATTLTSSKTKATSSSKTSSLTTNASSTSSAAATQLLGSLDASRASTLQPLKAVMILIVGLFLY